VFGLRLFYGCVIVLFGLLKTTHTTMTRNKLNMVRVAALIAGGQAALAKKVGVTQQCVSQWCRRGYVPEKWGGQVSAATGVDTRALVATSDQRNKLQK